MPVLKKSVGASLAACEQHKTAPISLTQAATPPQKPCRQQHAACCRQHTAHLIIIDHVCQYRVAEEVPAQGQTIQDHDADSLGRLPLCTVT